VGYCGLSGDWANSSPVTNRGEARVGQAKKPYRPLVLRVVVPEVNSPLGVKMPMV
jgi:hypothetical protein